MKSKIQTNIGRALLGFLITLSLTLSVAHCKESEEDNSEIATLLALSSLFTVQNPGTCSFTFGSRSLSIQEYDLSTDTTLSFPNGFSYLFKNWAAIKVPSASDGMQLSFNFTPWYTAGSKTFYLVYNESSCPITNDSSADMNYTFPDLSSTRTPTNYTVADNVLTFNSSAAGKSFIIIVGTSSLSGSDSVTRTTP